MFIAAGFSHFIYVDGFASMFPEFVPFKSSIVYATGLIEWLLALLMLNPKTRKTAGGYTAIYLVLIFPANIYAALYEIPAPWTNDTSQTALWVRLLFQPLLIWWVLIVTRKN
ncbi:DoxX family protein [Virgibacillus flavescens]|uniref:DoxX family protein n=1 Tax=Virgibacillus flavescens TaxID=1611422 RepID=UPI003D33996D